MAIRRPPTTFSDTISTADIADDAISGDKLANDIAISTTGNIATTGSGTLTVAGNTTLSGTNNLGSNPTLTLGSNTTFPSNHIITTSTIAWDKSSASDIQMNSTSFAETGIEVSITPKLSAGSSKIVIVFNSGSMTQTEVGTTHEATVARATSSSTTFSSATALSDTNEPTQVYTPGSSSRLPISLRFVDDSGYSAGTTYYYQLYAKSASATYGYRVVRGGANYSMIAYEIKQ